VPDQAKRVTLLSRRQATSPPVRERKNVMENEENSTGLLALCIGITAEM